jgi:peptidyl-prolyl cis-trans isomerase D
MAKEPTQRFVTRKHMARMERERLQRRYVLITAGVVFALIIGVILYGVLDQLVLQRIRPVATVAGQNITVADFQKQVRYNRSRIINELWQYTSDPLYMQFLSSYIQQLSLQLLSPNAIGQDVLDSMIEDELVRQEAQRRGITITEEELDRTFEQAFGFFEDGTPTPTITPTAIAFSTATLSPTQLALVPPTATASPVDEETPEATATPTEDAVTPTPEATQAPAEELTPTPDATATPLPTATPYTREGYEQQVTQFVDSLGEVGFTREDLRNLIRRQLLRQKVFEAITADVEPMGEQIWARHILVPTEEIAAQVIIGLDEGIDFAVLAEEYSTDTSSAVVGGDLGWFTRGRMVAPFEEAAFALEVGEVSEPVASEFGFHIIQLLGREERPLTPEQMDTARSAAYQNWLESAKADANVETHDYWMSVVPSTPALPAELAARIQQAQQQQQAPVLPDLPSVDLPVEPVLPDPEELTE